MSDDLPQLREDHPAWHVWASAQGHLYATATGLSTLLPGASVTVDADTPDELSRAIATAEREASRAADARERLGHGR